MPLKVIVDEDLPRQAVQLLREHGYDAASVIELEMGGWKDPPLWVAVQKDERFLVTADRGLAIFACTLLERIAAFCCYVPMKTGYAH